MIELPSITMYDDESKKEISVTLDMQQKAVENHNKILTSANVIVNAVYDMAISLKSMRDDKLYLAYGCKSFRQYCDEQLQISRAQVYNYINVLEHFGEEGLKEKGHYGITKLKQIEKESKSKERRREELYKCTVEIGEIARSFIKDTREFAKEINVTGTDEEVINGVFDFFDKHKKDLTPHKFDRFMDRDMALNLIDVSRKDPDEVMASVDHYF
ncbi:hypothetical protein WMZ97_15590 [Lentibacillus sp. N15]|uniref:hypothetical protein n=1 Tax=Lentibacillus songyuanensis TaxID=3136161 RepID=UPI0031BBA345